MVTLLSSKSRKHTEPDGALKIMNTGHYYFWTECLVAHRARCLNGAVIRIQTRLYFPEKTSQASAQAYR